MVNFKDADIVISETSEPPGRFCQSGHIPPDNFKLEGFDGEAKPTRFFSVKGSRINGIYCEICLCIANYIALRKGKGTL